MDTSTNTRQLIVNAASKLLQTRSFEKLTVRDICNECNISRQLFYYYFRDKFDLVNSTYKHDIDEILNSYSADTSWKQIAYYVLCYMKMNQTLYSKAFAYVGQNSFFDFFNQYSYDFIKRIMQFRASDDSFNEDTLSKLQFYSYGCVLSTELWAQGDMSMDPDELAKIIDENIPSTLRNFFRKDDGKKKDK